MRSNLKRNLLIGFSTSLIILIISSTASFLSITNLLSSADLVNHTNEVILELNGISAALVDAETGQRGYLLVGDESFLKPYTDSRTRVNNSFANIKSLTADNQIQQDRLPVLNQLINDRFNYLDMAIEAKRNGLPANIDNLRKGTEIMDQIRERLRAMIAAEKNLLVERTASLDKFSEFTPWLIMIGGVIAIIITISFYTKVSADVDERARLQHELERKDIEITERIDIIKSIADKISQGDYSIRVDDKQSDSLGSVAVSLNKMAGALERSFNLLSDKDWVQSGLTQLNDLMIGEKSIEELTQQVTEFLSTYTNSQAAALYIADKNSLYATAGYAYVADEARKKIAWGEGLIGQAALDRKVKELTEILADNIYISFATGAAKPNHVIALPILDGNETKGVIELATLKSFAKRDIEFLTTSTYNVGIAITTAQNRKRLQELLEETQSQSEELRAQHTELENMNSELEVQSEKLQASEEELRVQQEELQQANMELEERSTLLEERNQQITERNFDIQKKAEQLSQSTKYKSEFLANMSHELRTPLNSILLLSRLMSENQEKNLTEDQIEYAKVIQSSGHGLLSLIDEILDLSKIEAGKMQLEYQSVMLRDIVNGMQGLFKPVAAEKNIEFRTSIAAGVAPVIETDKLRLEQVLRNLLSNAIKFTSKGYVALQIESDGNNSNDIRFTVKDTGIGIPQEKQELVFEAFQQADGSTRRKYGGTGLGLSISRELVKLLGGEISLKSVPGEGSEFSITIPASKMLQRVKEIPVVESAPAPIPKKEPAVKNKFVSTLIPENIPDDRKNIHSGDKVILIIEDDINFAKSLLDFTRGKGYKGVVAVRGDEGVDLALQLLPIGILLDIQLPVKSGWEVMDELKANPATRPIPVHMMSSFEMKTESLMKGAVNFINKPIAFDQISGIFQKIEYVLTHHPKKVLIVEENPKHAKALAYFLETFDINIEIKDQVSQAIETLKDNSIDCVILDMGVPNENAYETLESVKQTPGLENLPIIIFTGRSLSQAEEMKIKQYADSIVVKTAHSYQRILDEVSLFLHLMEKQEDKSKIIPRHAKLGAMDEVLKNKTVLIADDDMRNIFSITKALERYQMKVIAAVDGKDALQKLKDNPTVDLVLMDMMMPEMDGYQSTAAIRKDKRFRTLPIIAVTAKAMVGDREKCISAGASDYITKPVDSDQLFSLLRVWLYDKDLK